MSFYLMSFYLLSFYLLSMCLHDDPVVDGSFDVSEGLLEGALVLLPKGIFEGILAVQQFVYCGRLHSGTINVVVLASTRHAVEKQAGREQHVAIGKHGTAVGPTQTARDPLRSTA